MAAVAAIMVGVIAAQQLGIARPQRLAVGIDAQPHDAQGLAILGRQKLAILPHLRIGARLGHPFLELRADRIERIDEIGPFGRRTMRIGGKSARLPLPPGIGALRRRDLVGRHAGEEIIALVEGFDMVEAEPAPARPLIARSRATFCRRRAEFAGFRASGRRTGAVAFHPAMKAVETTVRERVGRQTCPDA